MESSDIIKKIKELESKIESLPSGCIGKKIIKGNTYYYHRYSENNKRVEKYVDASLIQILDEKIQLRKELELQLRKIKSDFKSNTKINNKNFYCEVLIENDLKKFIQGVRRYKKRDCFNTINEYLYDDSCEKVLILYGLRRTGKTTLIRQLIFEMDNINFNKTAFIQVKYSNTLADINNDLKKLNDLGYKYVFIDEVTLLEDFIEGSALFSDIYTSSGIKIVLSGTDSLSFLFSKSEELYNRCILIHTTFIPYKEFEKVLGIKGIDEYIRYGGTMALGGDNYNNVKIFDDDSSTNEYIDTAIAKNIQHSLKYYNDGNHFRNLQELYEKNELTNVINRVVEDINHRFTVDVLTKKFKSSDLAISRRNLMKDTTNPITILEEIDNDLLVEGLKKILDILDKDKPIIKLNELHVIEIKEYLKLLDLVYEVDERSFPNINSIKKNIVISQPGLRYAQATSLIKVLLLDEAFYNLSIIEINSIKNRILNEIKGRMMEDIIMLETKIFNPNKEIFKLKFAVGEIDMVVFDPLSLSCDIYEIKYSNKIVSDHYKHLIDKEKTDLINFRFGNINNKYVIYRGNNEIVDGVNYINVEDFLNSL